MSELSLLELFAAECESQCRILSDGLVSLEAKGATPELLEELMRAAHSIKGAARIVSYNQAVRIAHAIEDLFVAAQKGEKILSQDDIDHLLPAVDLLEKVGTSGLETDTDYEEEASRCLDQLSESLSRDNVSSSQGEIPSPPLGSQTAEPSAPPVEEEKADVDEQPVAQSPAQADPEVSPQPPQPQTEPAPETVPPRSPAPATGGTETRRMLRVNAENLNLLLGSAAESLVASRRLLSFTERLWSIHRYQRQAAQTLEKASSVCSPNSPISSQLRSLQKLIEEGDRMLLEGITETDRFERSSTRLAQRLYDQALSCRMRPFAEITGGLRRAARDASRHVGYKVAVEIVGEGTDVDRDLLEKLESPLGHLIRNAIEHGIEPPAERETQGKSPEGTLRIEASHTSGFLVIRIADDGRGISLEGLKKRIIDRGLSAEETVDKMDRSELLDFLFLPGFSTKSTVSEMSGRGVGLDIVHSLAAASRGSVRVQTDEGQGTVFSLQFPVSLSVMRVLLFELANETYAVPLARAKYATRCRADEIESVEGRQFFLHKGKRIGLVDGAQVLHKQKTPITDDAVYVLILGSEEKRFGVVVSRFLGEGEVVIQPLDPHLGKVRNIAAAALSESGHPVLLIDPDDYILAIERFTLSGGNATVVDSHGKHSTERRRILVVEDSLTVRELERKLISAQGYEVETAVDGMDGWNAIRTGKFDAVVSDIDMPRMNGFELTTLIKNDLRLRETPVIIVSYKDREEDRRRGLDAGADYYLTKSSFQDEGLIQAIEDVLGGPVQS